jgi:GTP-binding protein
MPCSARSRRRFRRLRAALGRSISSPRWIFADLPGYGYAKISKSISAEWPKFIDPYLTSRETLSLCICLVDSNIPVQPADAQLIEFLGSVGRRFLVVGTKADRLSGNARVKAEKALREGLGIDRMLLCSAETKRGLNEVWAEISAAADEPAIPRAGS